MLFSYFFLIVFSISNFAWIGKLKTDREKSGLVWQDFVMSFAVPIKNVRQFRELPSPTKYYTIIQ